MQSDPNRREVLAAVGVVGAIAAAGCTGEAGTGTTSPADETTTDEKTLPEECPTTQNLGVEWPETLTAETVVSFVESYEAAYYKQKVVEYSPESAVDSYELGGAVTGEPTTAGDGYELTYDGSGGIYRPTLSLLMEEKQAPEGTETVALSAVEDETLREILTDAAETGDASHHIDKPGETVDSYIDRLAALSSDFEPPTGPSDEGSLYVDVDGTTVELTAEATNFHGDYWWEARYYVDKHVVRRASDEGVEAQDGTLLECRESV
jgi:hypothetical protein